jgi:hypothetical protein
VRKAEKEWTMGEKGRRKKELNLGEKGKKEGWVSEICEGVGYGRERERKEEKVRKAEKEWDMGEKGTRKRGGRVGEGVENVDEKGREKGVR